MILALEAVFSLAAKMPHSPMPMNNDGHRKDDMFGHPDCFHLVGPCACRRTHTKYVTGRLTLQRRRREGGRKIAANA